MSVKQAVTAAFEQALQDQQALQDLQAVNAELLVEARKGGIKQDIWLDIQEQTKRLQSLEVTNGNAVECYGDRLDNERFQVILKARRRTDKVIETYIFNNNIPFYFAQYLQYWQATRWDMLVTYNNSELSSKSYTAVEELATKNVKHRKRNREHEQAYIVLHEEATITCEETGISFVCRLPVPATSQAAKAINLSILHPLAFFDNVQAVLRQYYKTGIRLERELEPQVLAGMLLTIWKHKNLLICKDYARANMFLSAATKQTLSFAVRYYHNLPSTLMMPAISLYLDDSAVIKSVLRNVPLSSLQKAQQEAELFILNYIKACRGESQTDEVGHIKPAKQSAKVKLYSDPSLQQHKLVKSKATQAIELLDTITKAQADKSAHSLLFVIIRQNIKMLTYLSDKAKADLAHKIVTTFPNNNDALTLSRIFADIVTDKIEDDLLSFTQELTRNKQEWQHQNKIKVDFMSKITKPNNIDNKE